MKNTVSQTKELWFVHIISYYKVINYAWKNIKKLHK